MGPLPNLASQLRITIARYRRIWAACCAGLATLLTLTIFLGTNDEVTATGAPASILAALKANEVAVPILLINEKLAQAVEPGTYVQLIEIIEGEQPNVIANRARVVSKGSAGGTFSQGSASLIVVAVLTEDSVHVAAAGATGSLTLVMQPDNT
jgi:hypothetical protein